MKAYVLMGSQPLEIPGLEGAAGLRVEPSEAGTSFSCVMDPDREKALLASGVIVLRPKVATDNKRGTDRG